MTLVEAFNKTMYQLYIESGFIYTLIGIMILFFIIRIIYNFITETEYEINDDEDIIEDKNEEVKNLYNNTFKRG